MVAATVALAAVTTWWTLLIALGAFAADVPLDASPFAGFRHLRAGLTASIATPPAIFLGGDSVRISGHGLEFAIPLEAIASARHIYLDSIEGLRGMDDTLELLVCGAGPVRVPECLHGYGELLAWARANRPVTSVPVDE